EGLTPPETAPRGKTASAPAKSAPRKGKLVIVESPAKVKTVGRYLGKDFKVEASVGHVRDLLKSQLSVDVEHNFEPKYRVPNEKRDVVKKIKTLADGAAEVYLATDPDREGEAIAWHLMEAAEMDPARVRRVVFNEITKPAIEEAFSQPRKIDLCLVDAQQARRILDRLVGYSLSPILWRKVRGGLSAGRVQSVALRMIVDREREIDAFVPVEYWTIDAELLPQGGKKSYVARLQKMDGEDPALNTEPDVTPIVSDLQKAVYTIARIKKGERKRSPAPPFITSTLQQEASRSLGSTAKRTMALAQQLYEGIDLGEGGSTGLITYMRTDSTNVSKLAQDQTKDYITRRYGAGFVPETPNEFRTRARNAQEAHEAIRPTSVERTPESLKDYLSRDLLRLYTLIWQRFVASQMAAAVYDTVTVDITGKTKAHEYLLRASGSTIRFQGFLIVYEESKDEDVEEEREARIPPGLEEGQPQKLVKILPEQHFTQPPPRYTEATLVRALEENAIGRPSTYAPTLGTLQDRGYVRRETKRLIPTDIGYTVNDLLADYFPDIIDTGFTVRMEEDLDRIASGEQGWVEIVKDFYAPFSQRIDHANEAMPEVKVEPEPIGRKCPESGHELVIRVGRFGKFISCRGFPECRYTEPILDKIGVACPKDGGELIERKTRKGRVFYGCANYPQCDFTSWKKPIATPCPNCAGMLVVASKDKAQCLRCERWFALEDVQPEVVETFE
ncbi:MAG TPA: type I DNA topoisomerase, partial [Anaerolineales bacterium]|nr:type I DNA topoisomerase [Anaerolineales bacterium]